MAQDYGYVWRTVRLYCPSAPTFLAREWVQAAWKQLLAARRWGFMRAELTIDYAGVDRSFHVPADFASFKVVVDQARQVRLSFSHSLAELSAVDPGRTHTGQPVALVAYTPSTDAPTLGRARYLFYPYGVPATLTAVYHQIGRAHV